MVCVGYYVLRFAPLVQWPEAEAMTIEAVRAAVNPDGRSVSTQLRFPLLLKAKGTVRIYVHSYNLMFHAILYDTTIF